ncbi:MAG: hypothetical protein KDC34_16250 [Saprospiraceae bacterium]|nr:hypothetical protein [Saprospiraceae bacterium]
MKNTESTLRAAFIYAQFANTDDTDSDTNTDPDNPDTDDTTANGGPKATNITVTRDVD